MKIFLLLFGWVLSTQGFCGESLAPPIVGGDAVQSLMDAPFMVRVRNLCGGSIIDRLWVLTAAHCVGDDLNSVVVGTLKLSDPAAPRYRVEKRFIHPLFGFRKMPFAEIAHHDFALLKLTRPIDFERDNVSAIRLATPEFEADAGQSSGRYAAVFGWGNLTERGPVSSVLMHAFLPLVSTSAARAVYGSAIDESMIAAGFSDGGPNACGGDSGGPLVVPSSRGELVQVGTVSWGRGCGDPGYYGVFGKVSYAFNWIAATIQSQAGVR